LTESEILGPRKKAKADYEERMESIKKGREGREKFGSFKGKKRKEAPSSSTNREKARNKPIMMALQCVLSCLFSYILLVANGQLQQGHGQKEGFSSRQTDRTAFGYRQAKEAEALVVPLAYPVSLPLTISAISPTLYYMYLVSRMTLLMPGYLKSW
jgi:hypothetical protein